MSFNFKLNAMFKFSSSKSATLLRCIGGFLPLLLPVFAQAQVSGTVFRDFNANGVKDNTATFNEPFVAGVTVTAYNSAGASAGTTTTNASGAYSFTGLTLPLRIEFTGYQTGDYTAPAGSANASSVQFYTAASSTANFAVNYPGHYYSSANPDYIVSQFEANRPPANEPLATALLKTSYNARDKNWTTYTTSIAHNANIGGTWGLAYNESLKMIYAAAFVKRFACMKDNDADGKEDIGAIYQINASNTSSLWLNVSSLGVDVGLSLMPSIATRALPTTLVAPVHDVAIYPLVGKIGLGDIEISDDNTQLFFVNLYDKKVYTVDIATKTLVGAGVSVPSPCNAGTGNVRPFGLKYHRGKLYVGAVCDALTSQNVNDLSATVFRLDGAAFTNILNFPLNYAKGYAFKDLDNGGAEYGKAWKSWLDVQPSVAFHTYSAINSEVLVYPQPLLVNMEFDIDESLILTFNDRLGHQGGQVNYGTNTANTTDLYTVLIGGDILRAGLVSGSYVIENNGIAGGVTSLGTGNVQGPGGGEFYVGDRSHLESAGRYHNEDIIGGSAFMPGKGQVAALVADPIDYFAGGVYFFNNTTGNVSPTTDRYQLYPWTSDVSKFGKANGLGDMELLSNPAPLEIGNRIWSDDNNNGIQDAGEAGIGSIPINIYQGATQVGTTTTSADGTWYFNNTNVTMGGATGLLPNTAYTIRIAAASIPSGKTPSLANVGGAGQPDMRDSDAGLVSGNVEIAYTTGAAGANDHSLDFGFQAPCEILMNAATNGQTIATCNCKLYDSGGASANYSASQNYTVTLQAPVGQSVKLTLNSLSSEMGYDYLRIYDGSSTSTFPLKYFTGSVTSPATVISSGQYMTLQWFSDSGLNLAGFDANISCVSAASIGDIVWKDGDNDGLQNEPSGGLNSLQVFLYKEDISGTFVKVDSVWTYYLNGSGNPAGYYIFNVEQSGNYKVKFPMPGSGIGGAWATANVGGNDAIDNDADPLTGFSPTVALDVNGTGLLKSNMTIDAGYIQDCPNTLASAFLTVNSANNGTTITNLDGGMIWASSNSSASTYSNNENYTLTVQSPMTTGRVNVHPYFYNIPAGDQLIFYDGANTSAPVLATITGTSASPQTITVVSTGRTMTVRIISDASTTGTFNMEFSTGDMLINNCWGWNVLLRSDKIEEGKGYMLSDIAIGSAIAPICIGYFDANKNLIKTEVGTCINQNLNVASPRQGRQYGQVSFDRDTLAPSDIPPLTLARIAWVLKNAPSLGANYHTSPTAAANVQTTVRILMGQQVGGSDLAIQAIAAVPTIPTQPIINIAGCDTVNAGGTISYAITTNSNTLNLSVSDGGTLPTLCGTNPSGTTLVGNVLTVGGTGTRTVNLCLTRNSAIYLKLLASDETSLISTKVEMYYPCDPVMQRFLAVTSQTSPYGEACGKWTPVGSVGNYVWNDLNSNGINDEAASAGINGITVELWNATTNTLVASTTTANDAGSNPGYYNFVVTASGNYYVKFPTTNGTKILTTATTTAATDNNSDANTTTGQSPTFAIDVNGTGTAKDNPTIDAGYTCPGGCTPITIQKTR